MLVAVLMVFVVFSFTGVAALNVSQLSNSTLSGTSQNIKLQYELESRINKAMWRINSGKDQFVNLSSEGTKVEWDSQHHVLSVGVEAFNMQSEAQLDLSVKTPFMNALASKSRINTFWYDADIEEEHPIQQFDVLPTIDPAYFILNRAVIHDGDQSEWTKESLQIEGIHIFLGNNLEISGLNLDNSTLLFLGDNISFSGSNSIKAPIPVDDLKAVPAMVFMDPHTKFTLKYGTHIEGAIFCAGHLNVENATLTGPVVANSVTLTGNVDFIDDEHPEYYRWTEGFGNMHDYDWPKRVKNWKKGLS